MTTRKTGEVPRQYEITGAVQPLSADTFVAERKIFIPGEFVIVFNKLIAENFDGTKSRIESPVAVNRMLEFGVPAKLANDDDLVKPLQAVYGPVGWNVELEKDDYNDQKRPNAYVFTPQTPKQTQ